jgi:hypothetical protein
LIHSRVDAVLARRIDQAQRLYAFAEIRRT